MPPRVLLSNLDFPPQPRAQSPVRAKAYIAASTVDTGYNLSECWRDSKVRFLHWCDVAKDIALIQPSPGFMERIFSILRASHGREVGKELQ